MTTGGWKRGDEPDILLTDDDRGHVIEMDQEPDQRQFRLPWRRVAVVAALVVAAVGGYLVGRADRPAAPVASATNAPLPPERQTHAIVPTGDHCVVPTASSLQLGISITNLGDDPVLVNSVDLSLPMGGLELLDESWGACGQPTTPLDPETVQPGQIVWFTFTFGLTDECPQPYPVGFTVNSIVDGGQVQTPILSFPDLGGIDFPSC